MNNPIKHHVQPTLLLKNFVDERGKIYVYDKRRSNVGVYETSPEGAFTVKHMNSIIERDGSKNPAPEIKLSRLEGDVAPLIVRIVEKVRANQKPKLDEAERLLFRLFSCVSEGRAEDTIDRTGGGDDAIAQALDEELAKLEQAFGCLPDYVYDQFNDPSGKARLVHNVKAFSRADFDPEVPQQLSHRGMVYGLIRPGRNKSFVLGDFPQARMGATSDLRDDTTEFWFPISHDVAVSPWGKAGEELIINNPNDGYLRRLNRAVFKRSNRVAARSPDLLRSLSRSK